MSHQKKIICADSQERLTFSKKVQREVLQLKQFFEKIETDNKVNYLTSSFNTFLKYFLFEGNI